MSRRLPELRLPPRYVQSASLRSVAMLLAALLLLSACEPMGPLSGKRIGGELTPAPEDWRVLHGEEVVQLEVGGNYSVNLWGVGLAEGYFVVSAKGLESRWGQRVIEDPAVRLRVGEAVYELSAGRVDDNSVREQVAEAFNSKYELEAREDFPDALVFRLVAR